VRRLLRVAAYAVCHRDDDVLLARWVGPRGPQWTLPGGGLDHGEHPVDAAAREVLEETGYEISVGDLLTVASLHYVIRDHEPPLDQHGIQIVYRGTVTGGELRFEVDGSTDMAAWHPLAEVSGLYRVSLVDLALKAAGLL
jgi:8-oxo-dGTP diphosphatase